MTVTEMLKLLANEAGAHIPPSALAKFGLLLNHLYTGRWMKERRFSPRARVRNRIDLITNIARRIADREVLYLEFGVWKGEAIELWSKLLKNPASRLHGFDSFEGLPEAWDDRNPSGQPLRKGHFSTAGIIPQVSDPRVKFFKGWFEETLPSYEFSPAEILLIFLDADLYSSTTYVLKALRPHIKLGTIIYFDEFCHPQHELRAFSEFIDETQMKFEMVAADYGTMHVAFERVD
jgi:hypothetical protein